MKKPFGVLAALACLSGQAEAANILWQGDFFIVSKSGTCNYDPTGNHYRVRFQPRNLGTNGTDSRFALFDSGYAQGYFLANKSFSATAQNVDYISVWSGTADKPGFPVSVSFDTQSPSTLKTTTKFINIQGTVTNYDFSNGCIVKFRMALGRSTN